MIKSAIGHIQINVAPENLPFYKALMDFLGWSVLYEDANALGVGCEQGASLWFIAPAREISNDYDGPGLNHLAFSVTSQADVDKAVAYLEQHKIPALFDTPRHRPDFSPDAEHTYYQVMFESPDRILFEVVYTGLLEK